MPSISIEPEVAEDARRYAQAAVGMATRNGETLDFSERSIETVERILEEIGQAYSADEVPDDRAWRLAMVLGSYLGEVFVRAHSATWGIVTEEGQDGSVVCVTHPKITFWPWVRAMQRITDGEENNVWHYYLAIVDSLRD